MPAIRRRRLQDFCWTRNSNKLHHRNASTLLSKLNTDRWWLVTKRLTSCCSHLILYILSVSRIHRQAGFCTYCTEMETQLPSQPYLVISIIRCVLKPFYAVTSNFPPGYQWQRYLWPLVIGYHCWIGNLRMLRTGSQQRPMQAFVVPTMTAILHKAQVDVHERHDWC